MSYTIDGTDLSTLGITGTRSTDSQISLNGIFDFPSRKGTTERSWGTEIEAFVSAADIEFEPKTIILKGIIVAANITELKSRIDSFRTLCTNGEVEISSPYGTVKAVLVGSIDIDIKTDTLSSFKATFSQQDISFAALTKTPTGGTTFMFGGYDLISDFKIYVSNATGIYTVPERITIDTTDNYKQASYRQAGDVTLNCWMIQPDLATFIAEMNQFHALLASEGLKTFVDGFGTSKSVYAKDGFQVSIKHMNNEVVASFTLKLRAV